MKNDTSESRPHGLESDGGSRSAPLRKARSRTRPDAGSHDPSGFDRTARSYHATRTGRAGPASPWIDLPKDSATGFIIIDEASNREPRESTRHRQRRHLNILVAAIGIILTWPLMILIALAVKITSSGPVFYVQRRVGLDLRGARDPGTRNGRRGRNSGGRIFTIYKFRTMAVRKEVEGGQEWASADDPRITPIGAMLRKYRLDELPQFFNVLKGDMNVVGPRPEQPEIFQKLRAELPGYPERQRVLPGITGWAQVNHRYDQCLDDVRTKIDLDSQYLRRPSAAEDLRIMARTIPVMLGKDWPDMIPWPSIEKRIPGEGDKA